MSVRPSCEEDVVATMKFGREKGLPFSPRAGHHCVTTTMRHLQDGILIDMRSLHGLRFDEKNRQVTVGGGVITDDFVRFLESKGMEVSKLDLNSRFNWVLLLLTMGKTRCRIMPDDRRHRCFLWCWPRKNARKIWILT